MLRKSLFVLAHEIGDPSFFATFRRVRAAQRRPYADLKIEQEKQLRGLIAYAYDQVPYYRTLFKELNLLPQDIRTIEDLEKLPILTKDVIKANWEAFKPASLLSQKYDPDATGGSTGTPMQFRVSRHDRYLSAALLYRGWGYGGYELGDRMVFLAGSSLDVGTKPWIIERGHELTRNIKKLSSLDMADAEMRQYADLLNSSRPRFIRGYASSIYFFARWLKQNDVVVPTLDAAFTTAERLSPNMRKIIGETFRCEVYDTYGLNDGGVTAFECPEHSGLHIDTERSIMEIVDPNHLQLCEGEGEILATSLHNYAMPFIRYSTGDLATLRDDECTCGRHHRILDEIIGRESELLVSPKGRVVHGPALIGLLFILLESSAFPDIVNRIQQYQIVQTVKEKLEIRLVCDEPLPEETVEFAQQLIAERFDGWQVEFTYVDAIEQTRAGKFKFILNEMDVNA